LVIALSDNQDFIRRQAASALSNLATSETVEVGQIADMLACILGAQNEKTRNVSFDAIEMMGMEMQLLLLPPLFEALERAGPQVKGIGERAIDRLFLKEFVLNKIGALASHELTLGHPDIMVAFIGAGVDQSIPDIKTSLIEEQNFTKHSGMALRTSSVNARLIVGTPNSDIIGIAPGVRLISERVVDEHGVGTFAPVIEALNHVLETKARVVYIELGGTAYNEELAQVIDKANTTGRLVIAPAGNEGSEAKVFPAALDNVLAIAATDENDKKTAYSSYGSWVDISAPGVPVGMEAYSRNIKAWGSVGTSFSGAIVAGAAALVWSANLSINNQDVRDILVETADNIDSLNPTFEHKLGSGRINVLKAIQSAQKSSE
jgi:thermitase